MMKRSGIFIVMLLGMFTSIGLVNAQPADSPLLEILKLVPYQMSGDLYYVDYSAIEQAYPPARLPADWSEFETLTPETAEELFPLDVWQRVFERLNFPLGASFYYASDMPTAMGIDFFQIDRALFAGNPPGQVYYFQGRFDIDAVHSVLSERGFSQQPAETRLELWCGDVGCENSNRTDASRINLADLFGGDLGRQWARLISPNFLIGANQYDDLERVMRLESGVGRGLGKDEAYQAAIIALSDQGVLLQAQIAGVYTLESLSFPILDPRIVPAQRPRIIRDMLDAGFETLPPFEILMLADLVSETEQIAQTILVYESENDAETAARILPERIESYRSIFYRRPLTQILEQYRVDRIDADVVTFGENYVVRLSIATPRATAEEVAQFVVSLTGDENPDLTEPGALYQFFSRAFVAQDLGWLSTVTREELEQMAAPPLST